MDCRFNKSMNFRVEKIRSFIEFERRAVAGVQKAAALSLPSRVEL